ncbi:MAG TPA: ABC transporter permease [Planctomycetota bacterium]|nr:ABC transporter permease [Planctomycetota bacterium]
MIRRALEFLGQRLLSWLSLLGGAWGLVWRTGYWALFPQSSGPGGLRRQSAAEQMVRVGIRAVPIVCLVNVIVGMILAVSMGGPMADMGYITAVPKIVAVAVTRHFAPMITAIIMCGFVGAAMAAELGTMTVSEEVLALQVSGLNPGRFLVVPRMLAVVAMIPCLTVLANFMGMFGGYLVGTQMLGIGSEQYQVLNMQSASAWDVFRGSFLKGPVFGMIITAVACHEGLNVKGGADGVGRATTRAVVFSMVAIFVADLLMTLLFNSIWGK